MTTTSATTDIRPIRQTIDDELRQLNDRIMVSLTSPNEMLNRITADYLSSRGKQIRPMVLLLCAKLFGPINQQVISAGAAVEMLHNASLIHDDVIDESDTRRARPTLNGIWGSHIAVLVGDYFTSTSLRLATETGLIDVISELAGLGRLLSVGEMDQIYNARFHRLSEEAYMQTIARKTASLFVSCAKMGAIAEGVSLTDPRMEAVKTYALQLGLCFQITDDIFDYVTSEQQIGKPTGSDLAEGKITLPLLSVLLRQDAPLHDEMLALSRKEQLSADEISRLTQYAIDNGGIQYAQKTMQRLRAKAVEALDVFSQSPVRDALISLIDYVISRSR
jgi:octaprenyl-diphosphate synthase